MPFCKIDDCLKSTIGLTDYCATHAGLFSARVAPAGNGSNSFKRNSEVTLDNETIELDDKVWSSMFGWGKVTALDDKEQIITVTFSLHRTNDVTVQYVHNGRVRQGFPKSLFWGEAIYNTPKKPKKAKTYQWLVKKPLGNPFVTPRHYKTKADVEADYPLFDVIRVIAETEVEVPA